jgi:hypothetical protein
MYSASASSRAEWSAAAAAEANSVESAAQGLALRRFSPQRQHFLVTEFTQQQRQRIPKN